MIKKKKINLYCRKVIAYILGKRFYSTPKNIGTSMPCRQYSSIINKSDRLLLEEKYFLDNSLTINNLAREIGTNRTYLSTSIKAVKKQSFSEYINSSRIEYSKLLIKKKIVNCKTGIDNSGMTTEDYAIASGFSSARSFVRCFKMREGITPSQYKNALLWKVRE